MNLPKGSNAFYYFIDTTVMNKIYSDDEWVEARNVLLEKDSSHPDSDEDNNKQSVTRIFHGLYAVTTMGEYGMRQLAENVTSITVPNSGHFIQEEQPEFVATLLNDFFGRNTTATNSSR